MLPEVDSKMTVPDITKYRGFVQNISIRTMPYTNTGKGYTKITVTTNNVPSLLGQNQVYIPSVDNTSRQLPDSRGDSSETYNNYQSHEEASYDEQRSSAQSSDYRYQQMKNDKTEENTLQTSKNHQFVSVTCQL